MKRFSFDSPMMNTDVIQTEIVVEPVIKGMEITPCSKTKEGKGWDLKIIGGNKWQIENCMFTYNILTYS